MNFRHSKRLALGLLALSLVHWPAVARANPEAPAFDARAVGMGGTGLAFLDSPAALFHNPANLVGIKRFEASVSATLIGVDLAAPVRGDGTTSHTGLSLAPLVLVGAARRFSDRLVVGFGAYLNTGYGGRFANVTRIAGYDLASPQDQSALLFIGELSLPVAYRMSDKLDLGFSLRLPYGRQAASVTQEIYPDAWVPVQQSVSGFGLPGVLVGATYRPTPNLALALTYRSKVVIQMRGQTSLTLSDGDVPLQSPTRTSWSVPHALGFGVAYHALSDRLLTTAELRVQFHREANREQVLRVADERIVVPLEWKNVYSGRIGAEWMAGDVPLRIGYNLSTSASRARAMQSFMPPPGLLQAFYAGFGISVADFELDFAVSYSFGSQEVPAVDGRCLLGERVKVGCAGRYAVRAGWLAFSVRYAAP
ncbi:MAG: hypothetical protein GXP55_11990 [Deltaproteobacteria bacterium]|nr:hypothetical protein [Deltaproteobacteria bacterium]